jgi:hypothetical protein
MLALKRPMLRTIIALLITTTIAVAQPPKGEVKEFTGIVKAFKSGFGLAYEGLMLDVAGTEEPFIFPAKYGKLITENVKVGDQVTLNATVYPELKGRIEKLPEPLRKSFRRDIIHWIKTRDQLIELPEVKPSVRGAEERQTKTKLPMFGVFLDKKVTGEYFQDGFQIGLVFGDGLAAYNWFQQKPKIDVGDVISFRGHRFPSDEGFVYPVPGVNHVYFFSPLRKVEGTIKSLLFKQNYVCIGLTIKTKKEEFQVGIPSNYAKQIEQLSLEGKPMVFYFDSLGVGLKTRLNPPDLQAIVNGVDTLKIVNYAFYGGNDIKHGHQPASIKGKVTRVNRSDKGRVLSIIIGNDCYVEVDHLMEKQLGEFFRKGQLMEIAGDERIKAEGEVYSKDYRIITPRSITIDGKNFLLGQQP